MDEVSRHMSFLLRHKPKAGGLALDAEGFVPLGDLVRALQRTRPDVTESLVRRVVSDEDPHKQRYKIVDDYVRANYGHSVDVRIKHPVTEPPDCLMHGSHAGALASICRCGLMPMGRQFVHLTTDRELALSVGARRGDPVLIVVRAAAAWSEGVRFYRANEAFWLSDHVEPRYLQTR